MTDDIKTDGSRDGREPVMRTGEASESSVVKPLFTSGTADREVHSIFGGGEQRVTPIHWVAFEQAAGGQGVAGPKGDDSQRGGSGVRGGAESEGSTGSGPEGAAHRDADAEGVHAADTPAEVDPITELPEFQEALQAAREQIELEAYSQAFLRGEEEGLKQGRKTVEVLTHRLYESIAKIDDLRRTIFEQSKQDLIKLALAIAERLTLDAVKANEDYLFSLAQEAIQHVLDHDTIICKVNPSELSHLRVHKEELIKLCGEGKTIILREDNTVNAGGLIIHTDLGRVDATMEARLEHIMEELLDAIDG